MAVTFKRFAYLEVRFIGALVVCARRPHVIADPAELGTASAGHVVAAFVTFHRSAAGRTAFH